MHTRVLLCFGLAVAALAADNNLTTTGVQRYFNGIRRNLEGAADAMPADKFAYKLTEGQMTFAAWLNHATDRNYSDCAILKGETAPKTGKEINALKDKAEVGTALKDSFAYCADALAKVDDQKIISTPAMSNAFLHIVIHNNEIYGNIVGYLRSSGIVPPSTAGRKK